MLRSFGLCLLHAGLLVLAQPCAFSAETPADVAAGRPRSWIIPRPRIEKLEGRTRKLADAGGVVRVALGVKHEFGRAVPEAQGAHACQGEMLPKNLNQLFEGVHFNAGMDEGCVTLRSQTFSPEALAYFATAADYVWNPHDWEAAESCRRARRFVSMMGPLLEQGCSLMSQPPR